MGASWPSAGRALACVACELSPQVISCLECVGVYHVVASSPGIFFSDFEPMWRQEEPRVTSGISRQNVKALNRGALCRASGNPYEPSSLSRSLLFDMCCANPSPHHVWKCKIEPMWLFENGIGNEKLLHCRHPHQSLVSAS